MKKFLGSLPMKRVLPTRPTAISLFTGAGGMDIGFARSGFDIRVMVEKHPAPCKTLRFNWHWEHLKNRSWNKGKNKEDVNLPDWYHEPEPVILQRDITNLKTKEILEAGNLSFGEASVLFGGPPCQGFSTAGKRILKDPRNQLIKEFFRVVKEAMPRTFVMENVPGMVSMAKGRIIKELCEEFAYAGYDVAWKIIDAADYGVPQRRERVIIIGKRVDQLFFPEKGNPQLHVAAFPGNINHPKWFYKRYNIKHPKQKTLDQYTKSRSVEEYLQAVRKNKIWGQK